MDDMQAIMPVTAGDLESDIRRHLMFSVGETPENATIRNWRIALSLAIRDRVMEPWLRAGQRAADIAGKRVYYLSMEFLIGRLLDDAVLNLGLEEEARSALAGMGVDYAAVVADEPDAALGNGGLGRLAACFLDSLSAMRIPAIGYGIRYDHGLFRQSFADGWQVEGAEDWLTRGHAWEFERLNVALDIGFGGEVTLDPAGRAVWRPTEVVKACAYDTPIPGWRAEWVNTLRLWSARPVEVFDLEPFSRGDFIGAAASGVSAETISRVLYPDDSTQAGKVLRLKQEFFFTAASLRDLVARFKRRHDDLAKMPDHVAIQLNDTHPAVAAPELVRILIDDHSLGFAEAFEITRRVLNYTNHTLLPEALEAWPYDMMAQILPRHLQLIQRIDDAHAAEVKAAGRTRPGSCAVVAEGNVRMGNLAFIAANRVNGVSGLHTDLMRETVFHDLNALHPEKILSQTNGVTPRRWIRSCNPGLASLLTESVGEGWEINLERLAQLRPLADDAGFRDRFRAVKREDKARLAGYLTASTGVEIDPDAMVDIQIKRIHEYKRQLMRVLEAAALYNAMKRAPDEDWPSRVIVFSGKAAPAYVAAKHIIKLINDIAAVVNADPDLGGRLKIVYPPNYNVSQAEKLIPAADLSEQISTAGMEASGTGNMKFAMNGALTIGTLDGANVEMRDHVGEENIFIFGLTAAEVAARREAGHDSQACIEASPALKEVVEQIEAGLYSPGEPGRFHELTHALRHHDWFLVTADFDAYWAAQREVDALWRDEQAWTRKAVLNTAGMGWFSSDRTIRGYAKDIWDAEPAS